MICPRVLFNIHRSKYSFSFSTRVNMHTLSFGDTSQQKRRRGCTIKCLGGMESRARAGRRVNVGKIVKIRRELGVDRIKKWEACPSILLVQYYRLVSLFHDLTAFALAALPRLAVARQTALPVSSTAYHRLQRHLSMYTVHTTKVSAFRFLVLEFTKKLNHTTRLTRAKQSYIQKVQERSHSVASINGRRKPCPTISSIRDLHFNAISRPRCVTPSPPLDRQS